MLNVGRDGSLSVVRGDSFSLPIFVNALHYPGVSRYSMASHPGATLYFYVMLWGQQPDSAIFARTLTSADANANGDAVLSMTSAETESLPAGCHQYMAVITFTDTAGHFVRDTVIPRNTFTVED